MRTLEKKAFSYIDEHQMLLPGERVVAGISGGADSVCLLFVLLEWKKQFGLEPVVVHVNHGIRKEAAEDAGFVERLCGQYDIPFYLKIADIPRLAAESKCSEEEAGRNFRYRVFEEVAYEVGATKIAVAHNLNDRGETMLFNLFRGSGLKGLTGIAPIRGKIIRPILCVSRAEIEQYLEEIGQDYCRDVTNEGDDYTRNRIRHHILSYAEQEIAPGCVQRMGQTADILAETEDYLQQQTEEALEHCICKAQELMVELDCEKVLNLHPAIRKRVLLAALNRISPGVRDISYIHVDMVYELFTRQSYRQFCLPHSIRARRVYDKVVLSRGPAGSSLPADPLDGMKIDFQVIPVEELPGDWSVNNEKTLIFPQNQYTKWFDYDKIDRPPVVRTRETGDYLTIRNSQGRLCHKKLKDYLIEAKIPLAERDYIPLLAADSHIIWAIGYRISEYYKVSKNTKRVLQVQLVMNAVDTEDEYEGTD